MAPPATYPAPPTTDDVVPAPPTEAPQAVKPDGPPRPTTSLVIGYDADPVSERALRVALDLARRLHARLHVVHAVDLFDYPLDPNYFPWKWDQDALDRLSASRARVDAALRNSGISWTYQSSPGDPAAYLTEVADNEDALMIIVGRHDVSPMAGTGRPPSHSVSRGLIDCQRRPVLVVAPDASS